jgi:small subunit ribosomal protein S9
MADEPNDTSEEQGASAPAEPVAEQTPEEPAPESPEPVAEQAQEEPVSEASEPVAAEQVSEEEQTPAPESPESPEPVAEEQPVAESEVAAEGDAGAEEDVEEDEEPAPRVKPSVPGAHLEVDIVPEGVDPLAPEQPADPYALEEEEEEPRAEEDQEAEAGQLAEPISTAAIDLAAGARYKATGKRKTAIARVVLRPGSGTYLVNGRALDEHFPRITLQRNIRQPLETVGYQERMDVVARLHGGGISAQAGALRHGISRALLEADPNLRGELKRRGFLTRDSRAKERKKAGLKKARKRPQFSKR